MSAPDDTALLPLADRDGGPIFDEAWQAQVLALADTLAANGTFSPAEWSEALGHQLRLANDAGQPDTQETYYSAALAALEGLLAEKSEISAGEMQSRRSDWEQAYLSTPHGQPVELETNGQTKESP